MSGTDEWSSTSNENVESKPDDESALLNVPDEQIFSKIININIKKKNEEKANVEIIPNSIFRKLPDFKFNSSSFTKAPKKSLSELGYIPSFELKYVSEPRKKPLCKIVLDILRKGSYPDVIVKVGLNRYPCQLCLLQIYSDYFKQFRIGDEIIVPEDQVSEEIFELVYKWMLWDEPLMPPEFLVELFNASKVLGIPELKKVCWHYFDCNNQFIRDDQAFDVYIKARKYKLKDLQNTLTHRLMKFFLTLVASKEYLEMSYEEILSLLSCGSICVNSEVEVFFSAIRWINYDRENREQYLEELMKCIRFGIIPAWYLLQIQKKSLNNPEVDWVADNPNVQQIIRSAMIYSVAYQHYSSTSENFANWLVDEGVERIAERQYVFDKGCEYHHRFKCPHMHLISYEMFKNYLSEIAAIGRNHYRNIEPSNLDIPCGCVAN